MGGRQVGGTAPNLVEFLLARNPGEADTILEAASVVALSADPAGGAAGQILRTMAARFAHHPDYRMRWARWCPPTRRW